MVINMDLPWNPAVLSQRIARAHRHGQRQPVHVINLIAQGTIEERMLDTLAAKRAVFDAALDAESDVVDLSFKDAGQGVLQRLEVLLEQATVRPELVLEPTAAAPEARPEQNPLPRFKALRICSWAATLDASCSCVRRPGCRRSVRWQYPRRRR